MRELEPCPFCGAEVDEDEYEHEPGCYFFIVDSEGSSIDDIHNAWNRRQPQRLSASVECEPVGYMLTELSGQPREDDGDLYVYSHPFACNEKTDCRPVYFHPQQPIEEETRRMVLEMLTVLDYAMFEFADTEQKVRELKNKIRERIRP